MLKVTGLWKHEKDGKTNLSGSMGGVRVLIFPNTFKKAGSNEPDYQMYFDENKKKDEPVEKGIPDSQIGF